MSKTFAAVLLALGLFAPSLLADPLKVTVGENNALAVNGKKFLPIAVWLEPEDTFPMWKDLGINLFIASSHPRKGGTMAEYLKAAEDNKVYVSVGYRWAKRDGDFAQTLQHPWLFSIHHNDEPDKPRTVSDAAVAAGKGFRVNGTRPLFTVLDGDLRSSAVIDPPQGVDFTIKLPKAVTVAKFAVAIEAGSYSSPKELEFVADDKTLAKVELASKKGLQEFALPEPATFSALTVKIVSAFAGSAKFGALAEIQGLDAAGKNQLLFPARLAPVETPEELLADFKAIKAADPNRLTSLCIMARFMPEVKFQKVPLETYKAYIPTTDLVMFDLYPTSVYKGQNLHWNALGLDELRQLTGPRKALGIWLQASDAMGKDDPGMSPAQIRADAWLSLIHGATFLGYFPQTFNPGFKFHDINAARRAAVKGVTGEITALTDLILAGPKTDLFTLASEGARVDAMQRELGDKALLVLVNVVESGAGKPVTVTVKPNAFKPAAAPAPYGQKDPVAVEDGAWTIELEPWQTVVLVADRAK